MKNIWRIVNIGMVLLAGWSGFESLAPERLRNTNPDGFLCLIILGLMPLFALGSVYYSIKRWKHDTLHRFSWDRNPLNWWHDPLQSLFLSTAIMAAMCAGSVLRFPSVGSVGFWTCGIYFCMTAGLLIGQLLVYRIHHLRIIDANHSTEPHSQSLGGSS